MEVVGQVADSEGTYNWTARFVIPDASFIAGKTVKVAKGSSDLSGTLAVADAAKTWTYPMGSLSSGTVTLTKAGTAKGRPWRARLQRSGAGRAPRAAGNDSLHLVLILRTT